MHKTGLKFALAGLAASALVGWGADAYAVENVTPYLPCVSCGAPAGALPPAGTYFSNTMTFIDGSVVNGSGTKEPINVNALVEIPVLLYVPTMKVLGASVGLALVQPLVYQSQSVNLGPQSGHQQVGAFNTIIGGTLSWALPNDLFLSAGLSVYFDDGYYNTEHPIANNFYTFEPSIALSYLKNGWNLTVHSIVDANTENGTTHYQTGDIWISDFTAAKTFGKWTYGLIGYYVNQFQNDTVDGAVVTSPIGLFSAGNEQQAFALGPSIGYDFGPISLTAQYTRDLYAQNGALTDKFWFRFAFPF